MGSHFPSPSRSKVLSQFDGVCLPGIVSPIWISVLSLPIESFWPEQKLMPAKKVESRKNIGNVFMVRKILCGTIYLSIITNNRSVKLNDFVLREVGNCLFLWLDINTSIYENP
jgi:hypothetical protein